MQKDKDPPQLPELKDDEKLHSKRETKHASPSSHSTKGDEMPIKKVWTGGKKSSRKLYKPHSRMRWSSKTSRKRSSRNDEVVKPPECTLLSKLSKKFEPGKSANAEDESRPNFKKRKLNAISKDSSTAEIEKCNPDSEVEKPTVKIEKSVASESAKGSLTKQFDKMSEEQPETESEGEKVANVSEKRSSSESKKSSPGIIVEKRKKVTELRGRSSETAKAHRG
eukprot:TRINITY_DN3238_c0_g1_i1.p1 TRINITY_DN3238_c0_g1~~TRINITY_DN3238_c0_g1_i1.p1  ORF type:complete len:223 (-),score=61.56 TRINITY_DN3238_c0_g1_i1:2-670(-)